MRWEALRTKNCPYCVDGKLEEKEGEMKCEMCFFHIEIDRFHQIASHRSVGVQNIIQLKWQNLIDAKCPLCGEFLRPKEGAFAVFKCADHDCSFSIREDRMTEIINDPNHPANRYYQANPRKDRETREPAESRKPKYQYEDIDEGIDDLIHSL